MQQRIILTLIVFIFNSVRVFSQHAYTDSLIGFEYAIYTASPDEKDEKIFQKLTFMLSHDTIGTSAFKEVRRISFKQLSSEHQQPYLWNAAVLAYLNQEKEIGLIYWERLMDLPNEEISIEQQVIGFLLSQHIDTALHQRLLHELSQKDTLFAQFEQSSTANISVKGQSVKKVLSLLLPGSGLMVNGNVGKGGLALGINGSIVLLIRYLIVQQAYINAVLMGANLVGKFYFGNLRLLDREIAEKEKRKKNERTEKSALILNQLLNRYPIILSY